MVAVNTSSKHLNGSLLYVVARLSTKKLSSCCGSYKLSNGGCEYLFQTYNTNFKWFTVMCGGKAKHKEVMVAVNTSSKHITLILNGSLLCVVARLNTKKLSSCCDSYK